MSDTLCTRCGQPVGIWNSGPSFMPKTGQFYPADTHSDAQTCLTQQLKALIAILGKEKP